MNHITCGAMPEATTPIKKAPGAIYTKGLTTELTNNLHFATGGTPMKVLMQPPVPTRPPTKAAILAALTRLIDTPDVFSVQSLTTKKRGTAAMGGAAK